MFGHMDKLTGPCGRSSEDSEETLPLVGFEASPVRAVLRTIDD